MEAPEAEWRDRPLSVTPPSYSGKAVDEGPDRADANEYTYDDWAELLAAFFFDPAHDGEEILFAVDELSLAEASGLDEDHATRSLAAAIRLVIGDRWNVVAVKRLVERWRKGGGDGPHPALPFLALTVLAASRMGGYEGYAPHKFYVPLRRALNPADAEDDAPGSYLTHVRGLWDDLARWANHDNAGRRGRLTVRDPGWQYGRGLAWQHALVKSYDLRQLEAFFRRIGLQPGESVSPKELRRALSVWTANRAEPWARRLHYVSSEPDLEEYAEALLARAARAWDGRPRDPRTGRAVGRVRIGLTSLRRPTLGAFVQWDERLPDEVEVTAPSGTMVSLTRDGGWYSPHPFEELELASALRDGVSMIGDGQRFDLRGEEVYALSYDDELGAWVSVDSMSYGDRYHLLVDQSALRQVLAFVTSESRLTSQVAEQASRALPDGWVLVTDVRIDARPKTAPPASLAALVPAGAGPRLRLLGGLPLTAGHGVYLRGGEPSLALSTLTDDERISITRLSTGQVERFRATPGENREVALWQLRLEPDRYEIQHGDSKVLLQIVDGIAEAAGPGAGTVRHRGRNASEVCGTSSSSPADGTLEPLCIPAPAPADSAMILGGSPDDILRVELPAWLSDLVGFPLTWKQIDAWPGFEPVWLILRAPSGKLEASLLKPAEPKAGHDSATKETPWARTIALSALCDWESATAVELWERYRAASGSAK
jgi:hypothetical protein